MGSAVLTNAVATTVVSTVPTTNLDAKVSLGVRTGGPGDAIGYIYWPRPFPLKATIISAQIVFYTAILPENVLHTFTFQRLGMAFSASKVTWNTRPLTLIAGTKSVSKTGVYPTATQWTLDVTDWMQTISSGGAWYGIKFQASEAVTRWWYSEIHPSIQFRPRLEVTWSDAPATPSGLAPSGGRRVGLSRPTVRATYLDVSGSTQLQAVQVQANATDVWTTPTFDSGTVLSSVPELDLSTTAFSALADGASIFWRIRLQDGAGLWSPYSASTSFTYDSKGTLVLNSPGADPGTVQRTNRATNPTLGAGSAADWNSNDGSRFSRSADTVAPISGSTSYLLTRVGTLDSVVTSAYLTAGTFSIPIAPGPVTLGATVKTQLAARSVQMYFFWYDAASAPLGSSTPTITTPTTAANTPVRNVHTATAPAGAATCYPVIEVITNSGNATLGEKVWMDDATVEQGTTSGSYFDGSTPTGGGFSYRWTGTVNASTSEQIIALAPGQLKIEDATPPVLWTFTGETQSAYQIQITHVANNALITDWDSGKITSTVTSITVPSGKINEPSGTVYTITLRVWDTDQREAVPGSPVYVEVSGVFTFVPGATATVTTLAATAGDPRPTAALTWNRSVAPDRFNVLRNGKVIAAALDPADLFISGTQYGYTDSSPSPQRSLVYSVQAVVSNIASGTNPTATVTVRSKGIWLREPVSGLEVCVVGKDDNRAFTLGEASATLQSIAQNANKVAINQSLGGLEGRIEGNLESVYGRTAQQWRDDFLKMRALRVKRFWLTVGDYTFSVVAQNFTYGYQPTPSPRFRVGFDFYQQDNISSTYLGA